ncbi:MAG: hypothetical protein AAGC93_21445 [Cyanobacteria bacterium P01_F01_bin.53]
MNNSPRKNASQQSVWQWVTLKFAPTEPKTSNPDWQAQHSTVVVFENGGEQRIYFNPGIFSRLKKGDVILCHYRTGKWRVAKEQSPELMQALESRSVAPHERNEFRPPASDPRPTAPPPLAAIPSPPPSAKQPTSHDVAEIVGLFQELKAALPEAQETTIRAFSSTLFMQRRKEEPEF